MKSKRNVKSRLEAPTRYERVSRVSPQARPAVPWPAMILRTGLAVFLGAAVSACNYTTDYCGKVCVATCPSGYTCSAGGVCVAADGHCGMTFGDGGNEGGNSMDGGGSPGGPNCAANGASCSTNGDCCSASCVQGSCYSATCAVGATCNEATDCCFALACTSPSSGTGPSTCQIPGEFLSCTAAEGCSQSPIPLQCMGTGANAQCIEPCSSSSDCGDQATACTSGSAFGIDQTGCFQVACGPGTSNGTAYWGACTLVAGEPGLCLSFNGGNSGACIEVGAIPPYGACTNGASRASSFCAAGACLPTSTNGTACFALCAAAAPFGPNGGPNCPSGMTCQTAQSGENVGVCLESCSAGSSASCPAGTQCNNGFCD